MECFRAVAALDCSSLGLAAEASELLLVHKVLQCLANVDPLLPFDAEAGVLIELDAVLVEVERRAHHVCFCSVFVLAKWTYKRLVFLLAESTHSVSWGDLLVCWQIIYEHIVLVTLRAGRVRR